MEKDQMIYGIRPLIEAIHSGKEIDKILIQNGLRSDVFHELQQLIKNNQIPFQYVPVEKLSRLTQKNHQGIIAYLSNITYSEIENIIPFIFEQGKNPLILILDRITDVRNFGAMGRTAVCTGVDAIVIPFNNSVRVSADAIKSSAGALHTIPVCRCQSIIKTLEYLKSCGLQIFACTEKAEEAYYMADFSGPSAIIMGSEEDGISDILLKNSDSRINIPMQGNISSLNVSVAAGVVLFEAVRQRKT